MPDKPTIQFLGAAGTVTGSKHLITLGDQRVLLDCGMFQGIKALRQRNWKPLPFDPERLAAVVLSHAHIDHSGLLPLLVRNRYRGPIYCTPGTADLLRVMLRDSAYLQEEQASHANRYGYSKHRPALPLYTIADAEATIDLVEERRYVEPFAAAPGVEVTFRHTGHILGSASVDVALDCGSTTKRVVFSGDLGRWDRPILRDPVDVPAADILLCESTYGDKEHPADPKRHLAKIVRDSAEQGGVLLVPAFAVGRTQELVWRLRQLEDEGLVPVVPVYVDSPMAIRSTEIYLRHPEDHDLDMKQLERKGDEPLETQQFALTRDRNESKKLNELRGPAVIISASGMATGGRILHHMKRWLPDRRTTFLVVGYQAHGTRGRSLLEGAREIKIHGQMVKVRGEVECINGLSAHGDRSELLRWMRGFEEPPRRTYLVHGEPDVAGAFAETIKNKLKWNARVAKDKQKAIIS